MRILEEKVQSLLILICNSVYCMVMGEATHKGYLIAGAKEVSSDLLDYEFL